MSGGEAAQSAKMSSDFFTGLMAAFRVLDRNAKPEAFSRFNVQRIELNRAFYFECRGPAGAFIDRKALMIDFNPLMAYSPWFEQQLAIARRDLLVHVPTGSVIEIHLTYDDAGRLLQRLSDRPDDMLRLAQVIMEALGLPCVKLAPTQGTSA